MKVFLPLVIFFSSLCAHAQSTLVHPKSGWVQLIGSVNFSWNHISGADFYELEYDINPNFLAGTIATVYATDTILNFPTSGQYFWRVRSVTGGLPDLWSESHELRIINLNDYGTLALWLDPGQNITLELPDLITAWGDASGNGYDLNQATSSMKPKLLSSVLNGHAVVSFDGGDQLGRVQNIGVGSFFTVYRNSNAYNTCVTGLAGATANPRFIFSVNSTGVVNTTNSTFCTSADLRVNSQATSLVPNGNWYIISKKKNTPVNYANYNISPTHSGFNRMIGDIAEQIVFSNTLSLTDIQIIETYLHDKYSPPVNLGKDSIAPYSFCPIDFFLPSNFVSANWSDGSSGLNFTASEPGTYWVTATDLFGYTSSDTVIIDFPQIPIATNTIYCPSTSINWNADLGPDYTYVWSDASMLNNLDIGFPGDYWVELTDTFGCSLRSDTLTFAQDPYAIWLGNDTTLCSGNAIQLQSGAAATVSYAWSDGSGGNSLAITSTGTYWLDGTNANGCVFRDSIDVIVSGIAPVAAFSASQFCIADTLQLNDQSTADSSDPIATWEWDFDDGAFSSAADTAHLYATTGVYNVSLYVGSAGGCADSTVQAITIYSMPSAGFTAANYCLNGTVNFNNATLPGDGTTLNYLWNFGDPSGSMPNTSIEIDPVHVYGTTGDFTATLTATDEFGCSDQAQVNVTILPIPEVVFTLQDACQQSLLELTNASTMDAPYTIQSYLWDFDDMTTSALELPVKSYANFGYRDITLTVTADNGCSASDTIQVLIHSLPIVSFTNSPACAGTYTELVNTSTVTTGTVAQSIWTIDLTDTVIGNPAFYNFDAPGTFNIKLKTISDFGCADSLLTGITVADTLSADWSSSVPVIIPEVTVDFSYTGQNASSFSWDLGNSQTASTANTSSTYLADNEAATISLIVTSPEGCLDTLERTLAIGEPILDLEVGDIYFQDQNGYYLVAVQMFNRGTLPIDLATVELELNNGTKLKETYTDVIPFQESAVLVFESNPSAYISFEDSTDAWICATGTAYSATGYLETILDNNSNCKNREGKRPVIIGPFPNPADDVISFTLILSKTENVTIELVDMLGRVVARPFDNVTMGKGAYSSTVDLALFGADMYLLRLRTDDYEEAIRLVVR
jgi:PKD repeat protein